MALAPEVALARLRPGDLLVSDSTHDRILRVDRATGFVTVFSPVPGEENLLIGPQDMVHDAARGAVLVASGLSNALVAIDTATGLQTEVAPFAFSPYGVALASEDWRGPPGREIYVSGVGTLPTEHRIVRVDGPLDGATIAPELAAPGYTFLSLALFEDASGPDALYGFLTDCNVPPLSACDRGIGSYELGEAVPNLLLGDSSYSVSDVEVLDLALPGTYTVLFSACSPGLEGVFGLFFGVVPIVTEGPVSCPDAIAVRRRPYGLELFVAQGCKDASGCTSGVIHRVAQDGSGFVESPVAALPTGTRVGDLELVPEPGSLAGAWAAGIALAAQARRRR